MQFKWELAVTRWNLSSVALRAANSDLSAWMQESLKELWQILQLYLKFYLCLATGRYSVHIKRMARVYFLCGTRTVNGICVRNYEQ